MQAGELTFSGGGPDAERSIRFWTLGTGPLVSGVRGPHAFLQAGVHADEIPPMLVLHHLLPMLEAAEAQGQLRGRVTVVPQANPLGIRQIARGRLLGRFDSATGQNFNRFVPRAAAAPLPGVATWQAALFGLSADADIILDLHTDDEALPYLYVHQAFWPQARDLAACLGAAAAIIWDGDGGGAFEDAAVLRWLGADGTEGRLAATVELRGQADVSDAQAQADAAALLNLLRIRGVIGGAAAVPEWRGEPVPIANMQTIRAPAPGVLAFTRAPGERLGAGEAFARLIPLPGEPGADIVLAAPNAGLLLTRTRDRYAGKGGVIAKLTGESPFPGGAEGPLDD